MLANAISAMNKIQVVSGSFCTEGQGGKRADDHVEDLRHLERNGEDPR